MAEWKENGRYPASKFAINFREDHPELFDKLSDKGYLVAGKTTTDDKFTYTVKEITAKKDGKHYTLVERVPLLGEKSQEQIAHESVEKDQKYQERQKHIDELAERKLAILERIAVSVEKLARCVDDQTGVFHIRNAKDLEGE